MFWNICFRVYSKVYKFYDFYVSMRFRLKLKNGRQYLVIKYEGSEWEEIEQKLIALGLEKRETENAWGKGDRLEFYRESNEELKRSIMGNLMDLNVYDDINSPLVDEWAVNIAVFRVIPNKKGEVVVELDKYLTVCELNRLVKTYVRVYEALFNIVTEDVDVKVSVK